MMDVFAYDFGYSWPWTRGHLLVLVLFALIALVAWRCRWRRWTTILPVVLAAWALAGSFIVHHVIRFNRPQELPTTQFFTGGSGRVLDVGAGSGRSTVMVLLARPAARVTALDIYSGYFGIVDNTPDRLRANARVAGAEDRVTVQVGDMRDMPLPSGSFDAAVSVAAIDHLNAEGVRKALSEIARVLRDEGEFLFITLNVDGWVRFAFPLPPGHGGYFTIAQNAERWRARLDAAGFEVVEQGTRPTTLYFLARKRVAKEAAKE
jgi:SAM-dependent methyltransferase